MSAVPDDRAMLDKTISLMDFLSDVTDASGRNPNRDILADETHAPELLVWLDQLPEGVRVTPQASDDVLLRVQPPKTLAEPLQPASLAGWVETEDSGGQSGAEPRLLEPGSSELGSIPGTDPIPHRVRKEFNQWLADWRKWEAEQNRSRGRRSLYEALEHAAKTVEQQDDEYEFVLATGLIRWHSPEGDELRRHLVTEPVRPHLDRDTAEATVWIIGGKRRFEDQQLFSRLDTYQPDRARTVRQGVLDSETGFFDDRLVDEVEQWLGLALAQEFTVVRQPGDVAAALPARLELSASPALLLRPRSRELLAETYHTIATQLRTPGAPVPVALAQLVADTEAHTRNRWLTEQNAPSGDMLGQDPLFPLATNEEQRRVIDLLRRETGVVVQGPPGTGKTHTIANLVSALLARGMRVLVTSQKDQALKVLRYYLPDELRDLCVLLAGGSKDAAKELERGLDALSTAISSSDAGDLPLRAAQLAEQRHDLLARSAALNNRIRELREIEYREHPPVAPGFRADVYTGPLTDIVHQVKVRAHAYQWMPTVERGQPDQPPLSSAEAVELLELTRTDQSHRRARADHQIPTPNQLPNIGQLATIIAAERNAHTALHHDNDPLARELARLGHGVLNDLLEPGARVRTHLRQLGYANDHITPPAGAWVARAVEDHLAHRHLELWQHLHDERGTARHLQQQLHNLDREFTVEVPAISDIGVGSARGLFHSGRQHREYVARGRKKRRFGKSVEQKTAEKTAQEFRAAVTVNGRPPESLRQIDAALFKLDAEITIAQLGAQWAQVDVVVASDDRGRVLSDLDRHAHLLDPILKIAQQQAQVNDTLSETGLWIDLSTVDRFVGMLDAVPVALRYVALEQARHQVSAVQASVADWAGADGACPELGMLVQAVANRDLEAYRSGLDALELARHERHAERRRAQLAHSMHATHPALLRLIESTADDSEWEQRLRELPAAWAWSKAEQYILTVRNADDERKLIADYDRIEEQIAAVTRQLAGVQALRACLHRMTDTHARALRSYREHMSHIGAGGGSRVAEFRRAARRAMDKAKDAVPAWVVPLPNLLENISATRDCFDVVVVDEASQVGLEHLFLLWMAPRVIVVGDDKQCTPGGNRLGQLEPLFAKLHEYLSAIDEEIRLNFTPKSHLYGLLSARSGKDAVVRLREHFRCVPEIINWSSTQFYGDSDRPGLIPLRERTAADLEPLRVTHVEDGYTEGRDTRRRNPTEAKRIVAQLAQCLTDPRYDGKSFGVVVLQGTGQVKLLEHEINAVICAEDRQTRKIRVGIPSTFQGDERDVVFLSMVVAEPPRAQRAPLMQQAYNVAASRARDQMWLFTSVSVRDLKPDDLRASLTSYMLDPPSVFGRSPDLAEVSDTVRTAPFESLFEQKVFREIKQRGYFVVPQYVVGSRHLDLVVAGKTGRLAVECDGHLWHTGPEEQVADARRDRELRRMKWTVVRIRESEYEFNPDRELAQLWQRLDEHGIHPHSLPPALPDLPATEPADWSPINLPADDDAEPHAPEET